MDHGVAVDVRLQDVLIRAGRVARLALVAGCAVAAAGCSGSGNGTIPSASPDLPEHWRLQIDQVLAGDPDEFTRQALADYQITDAEYAEARQRYKACIEERGPGLTVTLSPDGGADIAMPAEFTSGFDSESAAIDAMEQIMNDCAALSSSWVESIYIGMQQNPRGLTVPQMIRGCFEANGVTDGAGLSEDEFAELVLDESYEPSSEAAVSCRENFVEPWENRGEAGSS